MGTAFHALWVGACVGVGMLSWSWRHKEWVFAIVLMSLLASIIRPNDVLGPLIIIGLWLVPAGVAVVWARWFPVSFERWVAGPSRRHNWRRWARKNWSALSRNCSLSASQSGRAYDFWRGGFKPVTHWSDARLCNVEVEGSVIALTIQARTGQTSRDITNAAASIAAASNATSITARALSPSTSLIELVMADHLTGTRYTTEPVSEDAEGVLVGRTESSKPVRLDPCSAMHVAIQGATRSGKSALCYGYLGAIAYRADVLVCGVDPTGILLTPFKSGRGGAWVAPTGSDGERVANVLNAITGHMDQRITDLVASGKDKIGSFDATLPAVVVVLEEYPGLLAQLAKDDDANGRKTGQRIAPQVERSVGRIIKEGAKVGVTVLLLAQRMSARAIDTDDRSNLPIRITLRVDNGDAVAMLHDGIERSGMDDVRQFPPGRGLIEAPGLPLQRFQADLTEYDTYRRRVADGIAATTNDFAFNASDTTEATVFG
ncbi:MAG: hypothetical protein WBG57_09025, partial [Ornithinimicrobium sp.]